MGKKSKKEDEVELRLIETVDDVEITVYKDLIKKEDCIYTINKDETTCTLHKLLKVFEVLYIPEEIEGLKVTKLENKESEAIFDNNENVQVKKVIIPSSVKIIGKHCFNECRTIECFEINEGVEIIDVGSFSYCDGIEELIFPKTLKQVEDYAIRNCMNLKRITFKNGDTIISNDIYTITTSNSSAIGVGKFDGTIYSYIPSKVKDYADNYHKNFELYDAIKMEVTYHGIRPTSKDTSFIKKEDIEVLITMSNNIVKRIDDYDLFFNIVDDIMTINISYNKFKDKIVLSTKPREVEKIDVSYIGPEKHKVKLPLTKEEFLVKAYYDNGEVEIIKDFIIEPKKLIKGSNYVKVEFEGVSQSIEIFGKKSFLFF